MSKTEKKDLLLLMRQGAAISGREQIRLIVQLSLPAIMAQLSHIVMQYIDASMVGRLGSAQSASIGLMASSTWLFNGLCQAAATGFTVQIAQHIGAGEEKRARSVMMQAFVLATGFAAIAAAIGAGLSGALPTWLGGESGIRADASAYFLVYALSLPFVQLNNMAGGTLQASGNMRVPSMLQALMCLLDVIFNALLIFPGTTIGGLHLPGAGLGVFGAALGTALAQAVTSLLMVFFLLARSPMMHLRKGERFAFDGRCLRRGLRIALPIGMERAILSGAQVMATRIVAPLGTVAIAANSFGVTAESLCYMPGYGIAAAATTLIGQSTGAGRDDLTRRLGMLTTALGMMVMTINGALMFAFAPAMIGLMSPDPAVVALGAEVLRIEAFAEPMFAASIVASGVFRGAGDTLVPSLFNFISMWGVRLPLSALLAPSMGLHGVWIAMALDLTFGGILFLLRLKSRRWMKQFR
ncbi:MAG: MATE family efflux transporter [Christensenellales bacterium]|nr:MATE family efflux transporter [Christensenellales bacterium]